MKTDIEIPLFKKHNKLITYLLSIAALAVVLIILGSVFSGDKATPTGQTSSSNNNLDLTGQKKPDNYLTGSQMSNEEEELASKVRQMLAQIEGAGEVEVSVRLASSSQSDYAINTNSGQKTTQEKDQSGGTRVLTETTDNGQLVVIHGNEGNEIPVTTKQSAPKIAGVLVVAQGAGEPEIKARLFEATCVALGVEAHKVQVMPKKEGE
jgi:stage III sporulation protein AG